METTWSDDMVLNWRRVFAGLLVAVVLTGILWLSFAMTPLWATVTVVVPPLLGGLIAGRGTLSGDDGAAHGGLMAAILAVCTLAFFVVTGGLTSLVDLGFVAFITVFGQVFPGMVGGRAAGWVSSRRTVPEPATPDAHRPSN